MRRRGVPWPLRRRTHAPSAARHHRLAVQALAYACDERDFARLVRVLHPDAVLTIDGTATAAQHPIHGRARIVDVLTTMLDAHAAVAIECAVNGERGIALHTRHDLVGVLTVATRAERISSLRLVLTRADGRQ
ncbi:nuclear transport factor 2 family protein [Microbacterium sp. B2969]|uniref:Nuclear transport factor 2 family protein n=1 Tax=Microbacterium alkaliflavum TaxID=3248839 RepID=A0ABW7Q9K8_9MICO